MHRIYDDIAESWYGLRHWTRFRHELEEVAVRWKTGRLLNIGCAHGPDFLPFVGRFSLYGVDFSAKMIEMARRYARKHVFDVQLAVADAGSLPFRAQSFDYAISIAAYHNIEGAARRLKALVELRNVLRPDGEALVTVWNRWQLKFLFSGKEVFVPWNARDKVLRRYYYLYSAGELARQLKDAGFEVLEIFPERSHFLPWPVFSSNLCALIKKPAVAGVSGQPPEENGL